MTKDKLKIIMEYFSKKKLDYIKVLNIEEISSIANYFIIVSVDNIKNVDYIYNEIVDELDKNDIKIYHKEGVNTPWVILDLGDIIIHIFNKSEREYFNLEKLWLDAKEELFSVTS